MYELEDAKEHLENMIDQMNKDGAIEEDSEFRIRMGHVFAHLNRGWNIRNRVGEYDESERELFSMFPKDLEPCG